MTYRRRSRSKARTVSSAMLRVDDLEISVTRKTMRNMYLRIKPPTGKIEVTAPARISDAEIVGFVRERRSWIERQRKRVEEKAASPAFEWTDERKRAAQANIHAQLPALLERWVPVIGRRPTHITLRLMTSRWGSCTPKTGRIRLNLQLGLMDPRFLEYVLVHEMTHLWANGHGPEFQRRMGEYLPDWRVLRRDLNREMVW
ncbi:SprT family zinc-dependent metalloprotease [Bifidobacterium sp. ESL0775]|uniref:M48 family metallopeptidase n=1 Tax=Bifidobacterium sp. ESL0775 TaxID=2983230 RepID=UPI0023F7942A|nr:SprT family zinc-dependent metalloprotease [Bifidobacterium sp. ESL0775]WEV69395.1 SprT family zinc-dependent metalloprotease [Bifidobacterium sp. ESL0775]